MAAIDGFRPSSVILITRTTSYIVYTLVRWFFWNDTGFFTSLVKFQPSGGRKMAEIGGLRYLNCFLNILLTCLLMVFGGWGESTEFPSQWARNAVSVSMPWCHHERAIVCDTIQFTKWLKHMKLGSDGNGFVFGAIIICPSDLLATVVGGSLISRGVNA